MMDALLSLTPLAFVALFPIAVLLAPLVRTRLTRRPASAEQHDAALEVWKFMGTLTAVFLIFLLVQSMNYFREAEVAVSREAGNIVQLDRALATVGPAQSGTARIRLRDYTSSVIAQEWPAMLRGEDSPPTAAALQRLQDVIASVLTSDPDQAARHQVLKNFNDVEDDRSGRAGTAGGSLPPALWCIASGLFALIITTVSYLDAAKVVSRMVALHATGLALLASLLFIMDGPYKGYVSVSPRPLEKALVLITARS